MRDCPMDVGPADEKLDWILIFQHPEDGDTISEYEAHSKLFDKTYHADVREGEFGRSSYYHFSRH